MRIESDRRYAMAMQPAELWERISVIADYPLWWPWLRDFHGRALANGDVWGCTVQPPLPYTVRFRLSIDDVVAGRSVSASITGDIVGSARLEIALATDGCVVRLVSSIGPDNRLLRLVVAAALPLARSGHNWVLDTGARQFAERARRHSLGQ